MSYCKAISSMEPEERRLLHMEYHDKQYGFPLEDDHELFGRLLLEINQAGLSWELMLRKKDNFRLAFANFDVHRVAAFDEADRERLLSDAGIVRNRLKINAAIVNANRIVELIEEHGSFANWLALYHPQPKEEWVKLFKNNFKFVGGEIVGEFLMSIGLLPGAHDADCPIGQLLAKG